jgi:hypothetical protein
MLPGREAPIRVGSELDAGYRTRAGRLHWRGPRVATALRRPARPQGRPTLAWPGPTTGRQSRPGCQQGAAMNKKVKTQAGLPVKTKVKAGGVSWG